MNWLSLDVLLIFGATFLLVYGTIAAIVMLFSFPTMRYRRIKYKDPEVFYRWLFIPILFPLRICYAIVELLAKMGRALIFFVAGALALLFIPPYFLLLRPLINFVQVFNEAMASLEKFVEVFQRGIRLGHWVMFYKSEDINAEIEESPIPISPGARRLRPSPKDRPDDNPKTLN